MAQGYHALTPISFTLVPLTHAGAGPGAGQVAKAGSAGSDGESPLPEVQVQGQDRHYVQMHRCVCHVYIMSTSCVCHVYIMCMSWHLPVYRREWGGLIIRRQLVECYIT